MRTQILVATRRLIPLGRPKSGKPDAKPAHFRERPCPIFANSKSIVFRHLFDAKEAFALPVPVFNLGAEGFVSLK